MLRTRQIVTTQDHDILLEFHCRINYDSETPYARRMPYEEYHQKWLSTSQPESYLAHLAETMRDERTVAEIWEDDGAVVGYLWVTFSDVPGYDLTIAEVMDIAVAPAYRRRGIGLQMMRHAEDVARKQGATLLRSDTGIENIASQRLHQKAGFRPYRIHYEKVLRYAAGGQRIPLARLAPALAEARALLAQHGYSYDISAEDLQSYADADTFYPSTISWDEILGNPLIVAHEVVEIAELKRMGLEITRDIIIKHAEQVYEAHLVAGEVELKLAEATGNIAHIRERAKAVQDWFEDPLVPARLRERYAAVHARVQEVLGREGL